MVFWQDPRSEAGYGSHNIAAAQSPQSIHMEGIHERIVSKTSHIKITDEAFESLNDMVEFTRRQPPNRQNWTPVVQALFYAHGVSFEDAMQDYGRAGKMGAKAGILLDVPGQIPSLIGALTHSAHPWQQDCALALQVLFMPGMIVWAKKVVLGVVNSMESQREHGQPERTHEIRNAPSLSDTRQELERTTAAVNQALRELEAQPTDSPAAYAEVVDKIADALEAQVQRNLRTGIDDTYYKGGKRQTYVSVLRPIAMFIVQKVLASKEPGIVPKLGSFALQAAAIGISRGIQMYWAGPSDEPPRQMGGGELAVKFSTFNDKDDLRKAYRHLETTCMINARDFILRQKDVARGEICDTLNNAIPKRFLLRNSSKVTAEDVKKFEAEGGFGHAPLVSALSYNELSELNGFTTLHDRTKDFSRDEILNLVHLAQRDSARYSTETSPENKLLDKQRFNALKEKFATSTMSAEEWRTFDDPHISPPIEPEKFQQLLERASESLRSKEHVELEILRVRCAEAPATVSPGYTRVHNALQRLSNHPDFSFVQGRAKHGLMGSNLDDRLLQWDLNKASPELKTVLAKMFPSQNAPPEFSERSTGSKILRGALYTAAMAGPKERDHIGRGLDAFAYKEPQAKHSVPVLLQQVGSGFQCLFLGAGAYFLMNSIISAITANHPEKVAKPGVRMNDEQRTFNHIILGVGIAYLLLSAATGIRGIHSVWNATVRAKYSGPGKTIPSAMKMLMTDGPGAIFKAAFVQANERLPIPILSGRRAENNSKATVNRAVTQLHKLLRSNPGLDSGVKVVLSGNMPAALLNMQLTAVVPNGGIRKAMSRYLNDESMAESTDDNAVVSGTGENDNDLSLSTIDTHGTTGTARQRRSLAIPEADDMASTSREGW